MQKLLLFFWPVLLLFSCRVFLFGQSITASHNYAKADSLVHATDRSARLFRVTSDSVGLDGTSSSWIYQYTDSQFTVTYFYHTTYSMAVYDSTSSAPGLGVTFISRRWVDSDSAIARAERQGGREFRGTNLHLWISASLYEALVPSFQPSWYIVYTSLDQPQSALVIVLNATDTTLVDIAPRDNAREMLFLLEQNYPNPFNPGTTIRYQLPTRSEVRLSVHNALGQMVSALVRETQDAGVHEVHFDGSHLASGAYFYRISAGDHLQTKTLMLIR